MRSTALRIYLNRGFSRPVLSFSRAKWPEVPGSPMSNGRYQATGAQLVRFAFIGILVNLLLYALYLMLTSAGIAPRVGATLSFLCGIPLSFSAHSRITFSPISINYRHRVLFVTIYASAYAANMLGL